MNIDILTPHYNQPNYARRCIQSIRDQTCSQNIFPIRLQHVLQDGSLINPKEFKTHIKLQPQGFDYTLNIIQEEDSGMYDALNRAFERSSGDIIGHLNCDEQYLPDTLSYVHRRFSEDPELQVLIGAVIVTYPDGSYCCSRKPVKPGILHTSICHLSVFTAATFYRRTFIEELSVFFDPKYKAAGDADLFSRILRKKAKIDVTDRYFSLFSETGSNLALSSTAKQEKELRLSEVHPFWVRMQPVIAMAHHLKKWLHGCYLIQPFTYTYLTQDLERKSVHVTSPRAIWRDRRRMQLHRDDIFGPHNSRTSCPPGKILSRDTSIPNLIVLSPPRCGTHLMIDALLNNLPAYKKNPLFVELDQLFDKPDLLDNLLRNTGYIIKTHYPITEKLPTSDCNLNKLKALAQSSIVIQLHRDADAAYKSALQMFPWMEKKTYIKGMAQQEAFWASYTDRHIHFADLICKKALHEHLQEIACAAGTTTKSKLIPPPSKKHRKYIYFLKFMTRTFGAFSPRINTGIRLGEPQAYTADEVISQTD